MSQEPTAFECRFVFDTVTCEVHVFSGSTGRGEPVFRAIAYEADDGRHELLPITDGQYNPLETLRDTEALAADAMAALLEKRFGPRTSGPVRVPEFTSPRVICAGRRSG